MCGLPSWQKQKYEKEPLKSLKNTNEAVFLLDLNHLHTNDDYKLLHKLKENIMQATLPFFLLV